MEHRFCTEGSKGEDFEGVVRAVVYGCPYGFAEGEDFWKGEGKLRRREEKEIGGGGLGGKGERGKASEMGDRDQRLRDMMK